MVYIGCKGLSFIIVEQKIETSTETPNTDAASNLGGINIDNYISIFLSRALTFNIKIYQLISGLSLDYLLEVPSVL